MNREKLKMLEKKEKKEDELSDEDLKLKESLELMVERIQDPEPSVANMALLGIIKEIKTATTSMTSVPKPLKFLRPYYDKLKELFLSMNNKENRALLSDILSVLAMTMGKLGERESLKFRLSGSSEDVGNWGHEYIRNLSGEISQEYNKRQSEGQQNTESSSEKASLDLLMLIDKIVPFDIEHNAEHEACDLLMEVELLSNILPYVEESNYRRICLYLTNCANYLPEPEDRQTLKVVIDIYVKMGQWPDALRVSLRSNMNDVQSVKRIYDQCNDPIMKKQLAFMIGRQHIFIEDSTGENMDLINNTNLSEYFMILAKDLQITEAKTPEDIYKSNLNETRGFTATIDSARQNLASTFVNAFVNAGFGHDKLMTEEGNKWLYKNKEHGMLSAAASLGMILLWDVDGGLTQIDKYLYANEDYIKAGALLAVGIVNSGIKNECDPALALLSEHIENQSNMMRIGSILGLGLAYSGSCREDLKELLLPMVDDIALTMEVSSIAALSLGMIFVGSANTDITESICQALMERDTGSLNVSHARFLCLGLGLLYLGRQELSSIVLETLKALTHPIGKYASLSVESCAYAGSGNVLKVQKFLDICGDHLEESKSTHQSLAAIGIALVAMGEEIGAEMAIRSFDHLLQYCEPTIRKAVPLALGLLSISNPRINVMDTLGKLSHDNDEDVSFGAILALGLIAAGTNNARVANMLRSLATYHYKEPNRLFFVRIAQGLVFMGKGTMTLAPYHSDRSIMSHVALSGLLAMIHSCLDFKNILLSKSHYMLFCLVSAMQPRMLLTLDENLKPLPVSVRVGQAVDTVGQAGRPKTITGFQTHTTPVLLGFADRAELATDDYIALTSLMEGIVILKKNPNATSTKEEKSIPKN